METMFTMMPRLRSIIEGITACEWHPLARAVATISYDNARGVLRRAAEMVEALAHAPAPEIGNGEAG